MSPVVQVRAGTAVRPPALEHPELPRRVLLNLAELVAGARLAGDVPLPIRLDAGAGRLAERLSGGEGEAAAAVIDSALARATDDGPDGAVAALAERGLVEAGELDAGLAHALRVLAGGAGFVQVDLSHVRPTGTVALRSWLGIQGRLVAQLSTSGGADYELAWFDVALWHSQISRLVTLDASEGAESVALPRWVEVPTELFLGARKALAEQRPDLVPGLAAAHLGRVLVAEDGTPQALPVDQAAGLLAVLVNGSVGRLRVLTSRRDIEGRESVLSWVLFGDGWHGLAPGPDATTQFRRRKASELGTLLEPFAAAVAQEDVE